jgi:hypothetical protein
MATFQTKDWTCKAGDSVEEPFENAFKEVGGSKSDIDLTNWDITMNIVEERGETPLVTLSSTNSGEIDKSYGTNTDFKVLLTKAQTDSLNTSNVSVDRLYEIVIESGENSHTLLEGTLQVKPNV